MQKKSLSNGGGSLNLDNVKCFISLAECLNFTKAAEKRAHDADIHEPED